MESDDIVEAAEEVHSVLGPGFTESVYHSSLTRELSERGIPFSSEGSLSIMYKDVPVGRRRPDLMVSEDDGIIILELKAGSERGEDQLLQYLDLVEKDTNFGELQGGMLIQFNDDVEITEKEV